MRSIPIKKLSLFVGMVISFHTFSSSSKATLHISIHNIHPISYVEDSIFKGPMITIVNQLMSDVNMIPNYQLIPWLRTQEMAKNAFPTLIIRHSMNAERKKYLNPILIGYEMREVKFLKKKGSTVKVDAFKDLKNYKIGFKRGYFYSNKINTSNLKRNTVNNNKQLFKMLILGRIDLIAVYSLLEYRASAKKIGIDIDKEFELVNFSESFKNPYFFSVPLNSGLEKIHRDLSCLIFKYRKNGFIKKAYTELGLSPLLQDFTSNDSLNQNITCKN